MAYTPGKYKVTSEIVFILCKPLFLNVNKIQNRAKIL